MMMNFISALSSAGLAPREVIEDGRIHRCSSNGKPHDKAGWYVVKGSTVVYGDWRTGLRETWSGDTDKLSRVEQRELKAKIRKAQIEAFKERQAEQRQTAAKAKKILAKSVTPNPAHPYLKRKQIGVYGIRQYGQHLILSLTDEAGTLWSLQSIAPDGFKNFMRGGKVNGCFHRIDGKPDQIGIAEGYSTAASVHELTGDTLLVAFSAGNLEHVAVIARAMNPTARLTIWADADEVGIKKAQWAATVSRAEIKIPDFTGCDLSTKPSDWNDYVILKHTRRPSTCGQGVTDGKNNQREQYNIQREVFGRKQ